MKISFDFSKLRGRIVEKYGSIDNFSKKLNLTPTTICKKLSGKSEWTLCEIAECEKLLEIPSEELYTYFFTQKVE